MRAVLFKGVGQPLTLSDISIPRPGPGQVRLEVQACGACRTDVHIVDGELPEPKLPLVLGHQIVGVVDELGPGVKGFEVGQRVGVPWLGWTCGECRFCRTERENLCARARFTGYHLDGGFAEMAVADARYCFSLPEGPEAKRIAPLLCAGLIGYRAYRMTGEAQRLGLYGFGSAAHILAQVAAFDGREVYAFTRPGDDSAQSFARRLGARWAGGSDESPPEPLEAAIIFAPVGDLVPTALRAVEPGGCVVCAGIHMSDIPSFPYRDLWQERQIRSVANLTRADGEQLLAVAAEMRLQTETTTFALQDAEEAIDRIRAGKLDGSAVLTLP